MWKIVLQRGLRCTWLGTRLVAGAPAAVRLDTMCRRSHYDPGDAIDRPVLGPYDPGGAAARGAAPAPACVPAGAGGGPPDAPPVAVFCWGTELHHPERPAQHSPPHLAVCRASQSAVLPRRARRRSGSPGGLGAPGDGHWDGPGG